MKLLIIDSCVRGEKSSTRKFFQTYVESFLEKNPGTETEYLFLPEELIVPQDQEYLEERDSFIAERNFSSPMFDYAKQFAAADEIVIGAPYWDCSFPSFLKIYFENCSVSGITFGTNSNGSLQGLCKAKRIHYFCTCGGFIDGPHLGVEYVKALGKMFGISEVIPYIIQGLDTEPSTRNEIFEKQLKEFSKKFSDTV